MKMKEIEKKQLQANTPFELAKTIRKMLDAARQDYGPAKWDEDEVEAAIGELVFEEG